MIKVKNSYNSNLDVLRFALLEFIDREELTELDTGDGYGITPKGWHWTGWTCYVRGGRFALYEAIPDIWRATDIADEKHVLTGTQFAVQNYLRVAMERPRPSRVLEPSEGVSLKVERLRGLEREKREKGL